jgi:hypothetical protein
LLEIAKAKAERDLAGGRDLYLHRSSRARDARARLGPRPSTPRLLARLAAMVIDLAGARTLVRGS